MSAGTIEELHGGEEMPRRTESDPESWGDEAPREFQVEVDSDDLDPRILRAARLGAEAAINRTPAPQGHNYGRNGEKRVLYWILGVFGSILVTLVGMGVEGLWDVGGALKALTQQVTDYHAQDAQNSERNHQDIQRIDNLLERQNGQQ